MTAIPLLLLTATLLPFFSFWIILIAGPKMGKGAAYLSIAAIVGAAVLSFASFGLWLGSNWPSSGHGHASHESHESEAHGSPTEHKSTGHDPLNATITDARFVSHLDVASSDGQVTVSVLKASVGASETESAHVANGHGTTDSHDSHGEHAHSAEKPYISGVFYTLGKFGNLSLEFSYYVDTLTVCMFCMVTLIASCIHFYATGYMHDELHDVHDHEVHLSNGHDLVRPGRFFRFFQYLSLFCFSMLGLVLAGNIALVFVFWELVGICSYFLIGFYIERKSASTAANKAFIVNRVGDFGMIIGLMAFWSSLGTFSFADGADGQPGLFSLVRSPANHHALAVPDGMIKADATEEIAAVARVPENRESDTALQLAVEQRIQQLRKDAEHGGPNYGYWLLVVGGIGIFCGCVGKSAQFPLHVWLPDAMEGPTPVSALVHSATMVAAGVYLVGRFYPVFAPEVLLVIAIVGVITLFMAATIAITAVDIKRVLAYSTISQLGYMMLSLGVGGWRAGLMHLITHAFFKSLLFMCSGSVIHAVHTNDMRKMGGLLSKMPVTAITMLIGCLAIAGVGVPFMIGFSGYYSKDAILEQAYALYLRNGSGLSGFFFVAAAGGAAITAFYMFRMWYLTFVGEPRDAERYALAHESPPIMFVPLVILSVFAISVAWHFSMIGYALIAAAFFLVKGNQDGWFQFADSGHGHDAHGHDAHGHGDHGHDSHGHDTHAHADHGHGSAGTGLSVAWLATMLLVTLVGGRLIQAVLSAPGVASLPMIAQLEQLSLENLLEQARPTGTAADLTGSWIAWTWPNEHTAHEPENFYVIVAPVTLLATGTWIFGIGLATLMYAVGYLQPEEVRRQFSGVYNFLWNKWWFDELYHFLFIAPAHVIARFIAGIDRNWIDGLIHALSAAVVWFSVFWERLADRTIVDGAINLFAEWCYCFGLQLRAVQTGRIRQYVMFIVMGALTIFVLVSFFWNSALAR